ncbi:unnamed protein product [Moneuplotes crassus]|uniref:Uncharacterized protein n=1 Tax=Euplotes crassus TaxID=5936 RepID=A0AAD1U0V8_EUPCR|nr:unnamed protein product [Moneuplotes crassus]
MLTSRTKLKNRAVFCKSHSKSINLDLKKESSFIRRRHLKTTIRQFDPKGSLSLKKLKKVDEEPESVPGIIDKLSGTPLKEQRGIPLTKSKSRIEKEVKIYKMAKRLPNFISSSDEESPEEDEQDKTFKSLQRMFQEKAQTNWKKISDFILLQSKKDLRSKLKIINQRLYTDQKQLSKLAMRNKGKNLNPGFEKSNLLVSNLQNSQEFEESDPESDFSVFPQARHQSLIFKRNPKESKHRKRCTFRNLHPVLPLHRRHQFVGKESPRKVKTRRFKRRSTKIEIKNSSLHTSERNGREETYELIRTFNIERIVP